MQCVLWKTVYSFRTSNTCETILRFQTSNTGCNHVQFSNLARFITLWGCLWYHWVNLSASSNKELKPQYIYIWIKMFIPTLNCAYPSVPLVLRPKFNVQMRNEDLLYLHFLIAFFSLWTRKQRSRLIFALFLLIQAKYCSPVLL